MTLPRLALRSGSRVSRSGRARTLAHAIAAEPLEARRMMCVEHGVALHGAALAETLAIAAERTRDAVRTDHKGAWYAPARAVTLKGATASPSLSPRGGIAGGSAGGGSAGGGSAGGDEADVGLPGAAPVFNVNAAGLPLLTSRANGAGLEVFLDFDGYGADTPFSLDNDGSTFNTAEQTAVYDTWRDIVSYFAPLNLNITTVQPATGGNNPAFIWHRISNSIQGGAAYVGWFTNERSNSWTGQDGGTNRHSGIAHEVGHQLELLHQAEYDASGNETTDYSDGHGMRDRPIIGVDFAENVRRWFYGRDGEGAERLIDDLAVMTARVAREVGGDGYRPDDFGAAQTAAATSVPTGGLIAGILERAADVDVFRFTAAAAGTYHIDATPTFESSVSPKLELLDAGGNLIAARDDADARNFDNNDQEFSLDLAAGTYYVRVSSSGDYAEIGEYLLTAAPLPAGWRSRDVGANTIWRGGTAAFDPATNTLTQVGGGRDIWQTSDQFRFTSTTLTGDGSITARVDALDNTSGNAKAGVMIRANDVANSAMVFVGIKPSGALDPIVRTSAGANATGLGGAASGPWVRLARAGNLFTVSRSTDGVTWAVQGTTTVPMGAGVQIGFATNSQSVRKQAYASYSNIALTGNLGVAAPTYNALAAPASVVATPAPGANTSLNVVWNAVADAAGYVIERSADGVAFALRTTLGAGVTSYLDANLFGSMRYFYRVSALDAAQTRSAPSGVASAVNKPAAPVNPVASYAFPVIRPSATRLLLNWSDVQGDNGYRVERSANGGAFAVIATTAKNYNGYNDSGLVAGTAYTYRVTPITGVGDAAAPSWTVSTATALAAPANFRVTARTPTSMTLAWNDLAAETGYRLERSPDAAAWSTVADLPANATGYANVTGLAPLDRYYYRLRALDGGGQYGAAAQAFAATPAATALPAGWASADVGTVPGAGAGFGTVGGTWTVLGSGTDIWGTADQFHFLSHDASGDGAFVARLDALDVTDFFVKAGVMFRASAAANAPYAFMHYSDGPGLQFEFRDAAGVGSGNTFQLDSAARWLKLARAGDTFTGSYSTDGVTWTVAASRTIAMPATALLGLAASSHNVNRLTRATFADVSLSGFAPANAMPTIVTPAAADPAPVMGTTADLTVGATDDGGAANLTYLWSVVSKPAGVVDPTFSVNGSNAASAATATFAAAGRYVLRVSVSDAAGQTVTSDVDVTVALRATTSTFNYNAARPSLVVRFNANVGATLTASDLVLENLTTGQTIPAAAIASVFATGVNAAAFTFSLNGSVALPDGNYRATFAAGSVGEPSGVGLAADATFDFFVLAGDTDRDRDVDFADLVMLAQNYGQSGKTFATGNLDYDAAGRVDFTDLVMLAQRYGTTLPLPAAAAFAAPAPPANGLAAASRGRPGGVFNGKSRIADQVL